MSRASRKEARRERLRLERLEMERRITEALARPRLLYENSRAHKARYGNLLVQVLFRLSWVSAWQCWEIRWRGNHDFVLYHSASESSDSDLLVGYEKLQANSENLETFVNRLYQLKLPIHPLTTARDEFASQEYGIALYDPSFPGSQFHSRFHWSGNVPSGWHLLAHIAEIMVSHFIRLSVEGEPTQQEVAPDMSERLPED
jgi:hypothetical protein